MTNTLQKMMTENTGRHMLDSGGAYGRNWERNQGRKFDSEPAATLCTRYGISVTLNVYHWLKERVRLHRSLDAKFRNFAKRHDDASSRELVGTWLDQLTDACGNTPTGFDEHGEPVEINTYNGESLLSQVLQFTYFELDGEAFVALQIHGGCDVRGGYTEPRIFEIIGEEYCMMDYTNAGIYCGGCDVRWYTDDAGNHWYANDTGPDLDNLDETTEEAGQAWEAGNLHKLADGSLLCPCCGSKLAA